MCNSIQHANTSSASILTGKRRTFAALSISLVIRPIRIFPATMAHLICTNSAWYRRFPGIKFFCTAATVVFYVPWVREIALLFGAVDCRRAVLAKLLESGYSLGVAVGGEAEVLETEPGRDCVVLADRKGFVRLALTSGADLVPTYAFGLNSIFTTKRWCYSLRKRLQKQLRVAIPIFYGRYFLPLPYQTPITVAVGKPIELPHIRNPDAETVDNYHHLYIAALRDLFDAHKSAVGCGDGEFEVLHSCPAPVRAPFRDGPCQE